MKQTKYRFPLPVVALMVAVSLVGCAKEEPNPNNPDRMTIAPLASLGTSGVEAGSAHSSSAQTKAPVSVTDALDLYVARADQTSASAYGSYEATAITAARAAGTGSQTLTLNPVQYYRADGLKTKLTGWYPGGGTAVGDITGKGYYNGTTHTVSWTIDGQQDVMTAPKQEGDWTSGMPAMTFDHRLTQLQFYPYAETQSAVDAWGKIIRIEVLNQQNTVIYNLTNDATGAVSFSGAATNSFSAGIAAGGASLSLSTTTNKVTDAKQMGNPVMIVPQAANHTLTLRIILADNTYKDVTLTGALTAGTPYRLYMKFTERDITIETTVAQWNDVTTSDNMGSVRIGDFLDGGIVYWVDGANYKVVSLEETATTFTLKWAAFSTYVVRGARSDTDGRVNSDAIKAAFDAKTAGIAITESTFDAAFPAAAECYNYTGKDGADPKGTWYLPAKNELQYLWCAYNDKAPISWESGITSSVPIDLTAQAVFDKYLTDAGGTSIPSISYWSSTENTSTTSDAWYVSFSNGVTYGYSKTFAVRVRCVKSIVPPPPVIGDFRNGGIVYEVTDATNYKVFSLESEKLQWSAKATYVLGTAGKNDTDGKVNVAAMKAYSTNNTTNSDDTKKTTGVFATDFPAAGLCDKKNTGGVTGWYLPATEELIAFYDAYLANPNVFNAAISANGGVAFTEYYFWSSTEATNANAYAAFKVNGTTHSSNAGNTKGLLFNVRCIRVK